jgi:hypothetical protein
MVQEAPCSAEGNHAYHRFHFKSSLWCMDPLDIGGCMGTVPRQESVSNGSMCGRALRAQKTHDGSAPSSRLQALNSCLGSLDDPLTSRLHCHVPHIYCLPYEVFPGVGLKVLDREQRQRGRLRCGSCRSGGSRPTWRPWRRRCGT